VGPFFAFVNIKKKKKKKKKDNNKLPIL
jgi:hypothetical protein